MIKKITIFSFIFISILFSNKIIAKAVVTDGFIIGSEVYETLNLNKEVSNGWGYESTTNTLILNNYNGGRIQIYLEGLNIKLIGNNYINDIGVGIESSASLSFNGELGNLDINMSGEDSAAITCKNVLFNQGTYNFTAFNVGIFASESTIDIESATIKVITSGMGFQSVGDIMIMDSYVNLRTNHISVYSIYGEILISNSKVTSISKNVSLNGSNISINNNSILALESTSRAITTSNLTIDENLFIIGGNTKEEVTNINLVTNQKYLYINREPNISFPTDLKIEKSGSRLILTWSNNLSFNIIFDNHIYQVSANANSYELEITNILDVYELKIYTIDSDGIESYHMIKNINNDGNPGTNDTLLENIFCVIVGTCTLVYLFKKLIKNKKNS